MATFHLLYILAVLVHAANAGAQPSATYAAAQPTVVKASENMRFGASAIARLGADISTAAKRYKLDTGGKLRSLMINDLDLAVDTISSNLVFACSGGLPDVLDDPIAAGRMLRADMHGHHHRHDHHEHEHQHGGSQSHGHSLPRRLHAALLEKHDVSTAAAPHRALQQALPATSPDPPQASLPLSAAGVPLLHSRPAATRKIFIAFGGCYTVNTPWNGLVNGSAIITPVYSKDDDPAISAEERADIVAMWRAVAEDYSPFDVDVTTEEPPAGGLARSGNGDGAYGVRVCVGGSSFDWYGRAAGGTAYVDSFSASTDIPVFVFPAQIGGGSVPKYVWEGISHEAGHALGLFHDGQAGLPYYRGVLRRLLLPGAAAGRCSGACLHCIAHGCPK